MSYRILARIGPGVAIRLSSSIPATHHLSLIHGGGAGMEIKVVAEVEVWEVNLETVTILGHPFSVDLGNLRFL